MFYGILEGDSLKGVDLVDFKTNEYLKDLPWYLDYQESEYGIDNYEKHNFLYQILFRDDQEIDPTSKENVEKQTKDATAQSALKAEKDNNKDKCREI